MFAEILVRLGFSRPVSYIKPIPTHEKLFAVGKSGPNDTFNLIFLGLGWPWVGEFVGFIILFIYFPTKINLANNQHPKDGTAWQNLVDTVTAWLYSTPCVNQAAFAARWVLCSVIEAMVQQRGHTVGPACCG